MTKKGQDSGTVTAVPGFELRKSVLTAGLTIFGIAAIVGIVNSQALIRVGESLMSAILDNFGWLHSIVTITSFIACAVIYFSKVGKIRLGGPNAKPKYSFGSWFAMSLTGGIAIGIVSAGVSIPVIFFGSIWGELSGFGIEPMTKEAAWFSLGRVFYENSFLPYSLLALSAVLIAYLYFNKGHKLTVSDSLRPVLGKWMDKGWLVTLVDTLSMLAIGFGITGGLAGMLSGVGQGFEHFGIYHGIWYTIIGGVVTTFLFTISSYVGLNKGLRRVGNTNAWMYYALLLILFIMGPTCLILRNSTAGLATWLQNFWIWGLDPIDIGGEPLSKMWTQYIWCSWIGYAPIMGIFLAILGRGRTVRQFLLVNWILPSVFAIIWYGIWGYSAINMQITGQVDLVALISERGMLAAMWAFLQNFPLGLGKILIPVFLVVYVLSYITAADATLTNIGSICVKDVPVGSEPPARVKLIWGAVIGTIAIVMSGFGEGVSGIDGVKYLVVIGGFLVLFVFIIQIVSVLMSFFSSKQMEDIYRLTPEEQAELDVANRAE